MNHKQNIDEEKAKISRVIHDSIGWAANKDKELVFSCFAQDPELFWYSPRDDDTIRGYKAFVDLTEGFFMKDDHHKEQVWLAGGIGIAPFLSVLEYYSKTGETEKKVTLFYCTNTKKEAIFLEHIKELSKDMKNFKIIPRFLNDDACFINAEIISDYIDIQESVFMICGPREMMKALKTGLIKKNVKRENIFIESFNIKRP